MIQDRRIQKFKGWGYKDIRIQGYRDIRIQGYWDWMIKEYIIGTGLNGYKSTRMQE